MAEFFMKRKLLRERKQRNILILKLFITANNQELGNQFHSFTTRTRSDKFTNSFPSIFVLLFLSSSQNKGKIPNFDVSLCLYHYYGTICVVKIKELVKNFKY